MGLSGRTARYAIAACLLIALSYSPPVEARKRARSLHPHPFPEAVGITDHCNGCSCKCGPGFRLPPSGRRKGACASWEQHWEYLKKGYPPGTVDEIDLPDTDYNPLCLPDDIKMKRIKRE
jgi:hypothetical protein